MTRLRPVLALLAAGALLTPAAHAARPEVPGAAGKAKAAAAKARGEAAKAQGQARAKGKGKHKGRGKQGRPARRPAKAPRVTWIFEGVVVAVDEGAGTFTVAVEGTNHHARAALGTDVTFSAGAAVAEGDLVLVQASLPRRGADLEGAVAARRVVVLEPHEPAGGEDDEEHEE